MLHSPMEIYRDPVGMLEKILWRQHQLVHELKELSSQHMTYAMDEECCPNPKKIRLSA